ncbi:Adaptive-response sensory-kinase SasA [bioreactor metagenome]|uniref:histidine kinase n=1 Tax=bioreactor metagenome TaxID=1076179 RepID=A0A645H6V5_9ZZZZ
MAFDLDMIERIMLNLLSNAIKFTNETGTIEVNVYDKNQSVIISVKDSGIGIPEDKLLSIFDRFTQVDNTLRRKSEGSGIGLSLVRSLIELHAGTIYVKSRLGEGSEFVIELPAKLTDEDSTISSAKIASNVERIHIEFSDIYVNKE